jgi:hypothetical protein
VSRHCRGEEDEAEGREVCYLLRPRVARRVSISTAKILLISPPNATILHTYISRLTRRRRRWNLYRRSILYNSNIPPPLSSHRTRKIRFPHFLTRHNVRNLNLRLLQPFEYPRRLTQFLFPGTGPETLPLGKRTRGHVPPPGAGNGIQGPGGEDRFPARGFDWRGKIRRGAKEVEYSGETGGVTGSVWTGRWGETMGGGFHG